MEFNWNDLKSLFPAVSGLFGVWLGGYLTWKREATREKNRIERESSYLAILVVAHLDRFVTGCLNVAFDDGTSEGRPAGDDGYYSATTRSPTFDPLAMSVEWKALPSELMYGILNLPYQTEQLENKISAAAEHDCPPDYADTFWERQHGYAELGLAVSALAQRLRVHAGLPIEKPVDGDWNRDDQLREVRDRLDRGRAVYEARMAANADAGSSV